jgi:hypothetical protein
MSVRVVRGGGKNNKTQGETFFLLGVLPRQSSDLDCAFKDNMMGTHGQRLEEIYVHCLPIEVVVSPSPQNL